MDTVKEKLQTANELAIVVWAKYRTNAFSLPMAVT